MRMLSTIILGGLLLFSCSSSPQKQQPITIPVEYIIPTKDQAVRRRLSEDYCKLHRIPVYKNQKALFSDPEDSVSIRTEEEVENRAMALCYLGLKSEGVNESRLDVIDKKYHISSFFTSKEKDYVDAVIPTRQQKIDAGWRYEDFHVMLWALGFIDALSYPDKECNVATDVKILSDLTEEQFRKKAKLRSRKEILDQADLILRLDWACVGARIKKWPAPGSLNAAVVGERHYALNWLISYSNEDWDNVTIDT